MDDVSATGYTVLLSLNITYSILNKEYYKKTFITIKTVLGNRLYLGNLLFYLLFGEMVCISMVYTKLKKFKKLNVFKEFYKLNVNI